MKKKLPTVMLAAIICAALVHGFSAKASGPSEVLPQDRYSEGQQPILNQYSGNPLDLQGCQDDCRQNYGVLPYGWGWGPGGSALANMYARCVQKCNNRYWKAWDKQMKNLGD